MYATLRKQTRPVVFLPGAIVMAEDVHHVHPGTTRSVPANWLGQFSSLSDHAGPGLASNLAMFTDALKMQ